jgi:hypothetical protein
MICRPQERFQSNVLQGIESLNLEVLQCNISSVVARVICIISAKVQYYVYNEFIIIPA